MGCNEIREKYPALLLMCCSDCHEKKRPSFRKEIIEKEEYTICCEVHKVLTRKGIVK